MIENDNKFSQIAFEFSEAHPAGQSISVPDDSTGVNVGVRIKALKDANEQAISIPVNSVPVSKLTVDKPKSTRGRKSLKDLGAEADLINVPTDDVLFERQYYAIGEVAEMFHVNTSLIRFWENEFDILQPRKNRKGDRHFRPVDIKNLLLIYDLLRRRKLTIEGAKDFLKKNKRAQEQYEMIESLRKIRGFLLELKATL